MEYKKHIMIIYGTEPYVMEDGRRRFLAAANKRAGGEAEVQSFQKDAVAATVVESFQGRVSLAVGQSRFGMTVPFCRSSAAAGRGVSSPRKSSGSWTKPGGSVTRTAFCFILRARWIRAVLFLRP